VYAGFEDGLFLGFQNTDDGYIRCESAAIVAPANGSDYAFFPTDQLTGKATSAVPTESFPDYDPRSRPW
jgi:hypothetical protein